MKIWITWTAGLACTALAAPALAQTGGGQTQPSGTGGTTAARRDHPMTIRQASGGGAPHGPRTARQPTARAPHPSAGTVNRPHGGTHATTSKGMNAIAKGPTKPAVDPR